jgi:hypothetical protein
MNAVGRVDAGPEWEIRGRRAAVLDPAIDNPPGITELQGYLD